MIYYLRILIVLTVAFITLELKAEEKLHISLGDNYGKHAMLVDGKPAGIQKDLLTWFLIEHMKLDVTLEAMPWKRAQQLVVERKKSDGYFTAYTKKRVEQLKLRPSNPAFYKTSVKMHTWKHNPKLDRLKSIKSVDVLISQLDIKHVMINGHGYQEALYQNAERVIRINSARQIPKFLLQYKRADVFVEQSELFYPLVEEDGLLDEVVTLDNISFKNLHWHLFIRADSPHFQLMDKIDRELNKLIAQGTMFKKVKEVFARYGLDYMEKD